MSKLAAVLLVVSGCIGIEPSSTDFEPDQTEHVVRMFEDNKRITFVQRAEGITDRFGAPSQQYAHGTSGRVSLPIVER